MSFAHIGCDREFQEARLKSAFFVRDPKKLSGVLSVARQNQPLLKQSVEFPICQEFKTFGESSTLHFTLRPDAADTASYP